LNARAADHPAMHTHTAGTRTTVAREGAPLRSRVGGGGGGCAFGGG